MYCARLKNVHDLALGKEVVFHNTGANSNEHYSSLDTCTVCHGSGKASMEEAAKIKKRQQFWNGILKN